MAKKVNKTIARGLAVKMIDNTENPEQLRDLAVNSLTELYLSDNRFFRMDKDIIEGQEKLSEIISEVSRIEAENATN
tara:strand:+ start:2147 stop:2377 length:231 start_codon:yes stop_codon:yes gene_type:complete